jgi:hypothetical protein
MINEGLDLTGQWVSLRPSCRTTRNGIKCKIQGKLNIENTGTQNAPSSLVNLYLSDDGVSYDLEDPFKQMPIGSIKRKKSKLKSLNYGFPTGEDIKAKYIIVVIDPENRVEEIDKTNNTIVFGPIA